MKDIKEGTVLIMWWDIRWDIWWDMSVITKK